MTTCPNSTAGGCSCPEHHAGLLAYSRDPVALARALDRLRPQRPVLVYTSGPACTGTMTCPCTLCDRERQQAAARIRSAGEPRQPWHPRPAKAA